MDLYDSLDLEMFLYALQTQIRTKFKDRSIQIVPQYEFTLRTVLFLWVCFSCAYLFLLLFTETIFIKKVFYTFICGYCISTFAVERMKWANPLRKSISIRNMDICSHVSLHDSTFTIWLWFLPLGGLWTFLVSVYFSCVEDTWMSVLLVFTSFLCSVGACFMPITMRNFIGRIFNWHIPAVGLWLFFGGLGQII